MQGQFLPWHRWYIYAHEVMLRHQCNYTGPLPWWDEAKDADTGNAFSSTMWSADAFGGNGTGSDLCVVDGAFANYTEHPRYTTLIKCPFCVARNPPNT